MNGYNTDDDRKVYFEKIFKDEMVDFYVDSIDFCKKVMDKNVFPLASYINLSPPSMRSDYGAGL